MKTEAQFPVWQAMSTWYRAVSKQARSPISVGTMSSMPLTALLLLLLLLLPSCETVDFRGAADKSGNQSAFSKLYDGHDKRAIEAGGSSRALDEQWRRVVDTKAKLTGALEAADDEDDEEEIEELLELVDYAEDVLKKTRQSEPAPKDVLSATMQVERILTEVDHAAEERRNDDLFDATSNFIYTALFGHSLPALSEAKQNRPLGVRAAEREARFLYNVETGEFYSPSDLAGMTPEQVSQLDVSNRHPAWYRQEQRARLRNGRIEDFEAWMQSGVTDVLHREGDLPHGRGWDMAGARRVLFMDEVYKSATSPKAKTEDAYGVEWKIKWGDEVQSEAVSSRLYLMAGGKMTDLVFVGDPGPEGMTLILSEAGEYEDEKAEEGAEREPETVQQLVQTLHDFYGFDALPYIHSHGIITGENVDSLLRHLPPNGRSEYRKEKLIGRHWVSFREYLLELRPDGFVRRENGARMSDFAATQDRVARGLYLLSLWMSNRDVKDDNNKAYFIKRSGDGRIVDYREGHHDLGVTLGTMGASGEINAMQTGDEFMDHGIMGRNFRFRQTYIYKPDAWKQATWADCKWMARSIADLTVTEIREAVAASKWPDFMQQALVYKLVDRRNRIAEMYGLADMLDSTLVNAPSLTIDLGGPAQIAAVERRYGLQRGSLAAELAAMNVGPGYSETLVYEGQVTASDRSAVIRQLTWQHHPAGLSDRYRRMLDTPPEALRD